VVPAAAELPAAADVLPAAPVDPGEPPAARPDPPVLTESLPPPPLDDSPVVMPVVLVPSPWLPSLPATLSFPSKALHPLAAISSDSASSRKRQ
jgi:hypothetical protein